MNSDVKEKWTEALRSGKYKQITEKLRDDENGRCCLGVLCDLFIEEQGGAKWDGHQFVLLDEDDNTIEFSNDGLVHAVQDWAGLDNRAGAFVPYDAGSEDEIDLASLNDGGPGLDNIEQHSFDEIADLIEKHL